MITSPLLRLLARGGAKELEAAERVATVGRREASEHSADESWIENFLCGAEPFTGSGEPHVSHSSVGLGAVTHDVALSDEAVDRNGHGGHGHAHVGGQLREGCGLHRIEVAQNARLPCADPRTRFRVVYVARVAGEVDLGVQRDEVVAGSDSHAAAIMH